MFQDHIADQNVAVGTAADPAVRSRTASAGTLNACTGVAGDRLGDQSAKALDPEGDT
jgi:hypothetical protein